MEAFTNASFLCEEYYNCAPDIAIKGKPFYLLLIKKVEFSHQREYRYFIEKYFYVNFFFSY